MNFRDVFRTLAAGTVAVACMSVASGQDEFPTVTSDVTFDDDGNIAIKLEFVPDDSFSTVASIKLFGGTELPLPVELYDGTVPAGAQAKKLTLTEVKPGLSWTTTHGADQEGNLVGSNHYWLFAVVAETAAEDSPVHYLGVGYWRRNPGMQHFRPWPLSGEPMATASASFAPDGSVSVSVSVAKVGQYDELVKMIVHGGQETPAPTPANPPDTDDEDYDGELIFDRWYPMDNPNPWIESRPDAEDRDAAAFDPLGSEYWVYAQITCRTSPTSTAHTFHYKAMFADLQYDTVQMTLLAPLQVSGSTLNKNDKQVTLHLRPLKIPDGHGGEYVVKKVSIWGRGRNYAGGWPRKNPDDFKESPAATWTATLNSASPRIVVEVELAKQNGRRWRYLLFHGRRADFGGDSPLLLQDLTRGEPVKRGQKVGKMVRRRKP